MKATPIHPPNLGWLETDLDRPTMSYLWECIKESGDEQPCKDTLIGQIDRSFRVKDKDGSFWNSVLNPLCGYYGDVFTNEHADVNVQPLVEGDSFELYLREFWVNFQKKHEYNPTHNHGGVYSFVIWMKIPTRFEDQAKISNSRDSNSKYNSTFQFQYIDILGRSRTYLYALNPEDEGKLIIFPSKLLHAVYPFYECDEERISMSGNIWLK